MIKKQHIIIALLCITCTCLGACFAFAFHNEMLIAKCQVTGEHLHLDMSKAELYDEILQRNQNLLAGFNELQDVHKVPPCAIVPMMGNIMIIDGFIKFLIENREVIIFAEELAKGKYF